MKNNTIKALITASLIYGSQMNLYAIPSPIISKDGKVLQMDSTDSQVSAQLQEFKRKQDWKSFSVLFNNMISKFPPKSDGKEFSDVIKYADYSDTWNLNSAAWDVFLGCNDKAILKEALKWSSLSMKLESTAKGGQNVQYLDTKANLLYKLGKKKEAIELEQEAAKSGGLLAKGYLESIEKMQKGLPTWPTTK